MTKCTTPNCSRSCGKASASELDKRLLLAALENLALPTTTGLLRRSLEDLVQVLSSPSLVMTFST